MKPGSERQLQGLSAFVHGILVAFHALGIVYNWKRKNWVDVCCHSGAAAYDVWATKKHLEALQHDDSDTTVEPLSCPLCRGLSPAVRLDGGQQVEAS